MKITKKIYLIIKYGLGEVVRDLDDTKKFDKYIYPISRAVGVLFIAFIIVVPFPEKRIYTVTYKSSQTASSSLQYVDKGIKIDGFNERSPYYSSIISKLMGVEILPVPVSVCLYNNNKLIAKKDEVISEQPKEDKEVGAMSVTIKQNNDKGEIELYTKVNTHICKELISSALDQAYMQLPLVRNYLTLDTGTIDISKSYVEMTAVRNWIMLRNYILAILALALVLNLLEALYRFVLWKW